MTLNTAANLAAASAAHVPAAVAVYPDPGDPDQGWLQAAAWGYPGVPATSTVEEAETEIVHFVYRRRRRLRAKKLTLGV